MAESEKHLTAGEKKKRRQKNSVGNKKRDEAEEDAAAISPFTWGLQKKISPDIERGK